MNEKAIGVFDSGLGGLTVVKQIKELLPNESIVYLGDTARVPYGTRSMDTIVEFSLQDVNFLESKGVKCIVIACHTASSNAADKVRKHTGLPVIDVVTATLDFLKEKKGSKKIAVIGTSATINSHVYSNRLKNTPLDIIEKDCPLLVPFIEEGETKGELLEGVIEKYLKPLKGKVDTLVMACTHYPILRDEIAEFMETEVEIVDPGELAAVKLKDFLKENDMLGGNNKGDGRYFVTDLRESFKRVAEMFLGEGLDKRIEVVELDSVKM